MNTEIENVAKEQGLVLLGVVGTQAKKDFKHYQQWIKAGFHGEMQYLENHQNIRENPASLLPNSKTIIMLGLPYGSEQKIDEPAVAKYAPLFDYHRFFKIAGQRMMERIGVEPADYRVLVDTAPILERAFGAQTRSGFIGKNTCFIHKELGSFLLLGEILTTIALPVDTPPQIPISHKTKQGGCGPCNLCQVHCPTGALNKDYSIDATKCLAYWTIEQRGPIPEKYWPHLAKYYFGCDICQDVCPYNAKKILKTPLAKRDLPDLFTTATMNQQEYELFFGGTPMTRAKRNGLRRNALIAMAVTGHPRLSEAMDVASQDPGGAVGETVRGIKARLTKE